MIDNISAQGVGGYNLPPQNSNLNDEQKAQLSEILSGYDPKNMTDDSKYQLFEDLKAAGIPKGRDLKKALDEVGIEAPTRRKKRSNEYQTKVNNQESAKSSEMIARNLELLEKYNPENVTDEDIDHVLKKVKATGFSITGLFLNIEV